MTPGQIVKLTWGDAWGAAGWASDGAVVGDHEPLDVLHVGIVVKHDATGISLASGKGANGSWLAAGFIPAGMIQTVDVLE